MSENQTNNHQLTDNQARNAFRIALVTFILTGLISAYYANEAITRGQNVWKFPGPAFLALIISFASFLSIFLVRIWRSLWGVGLILISFGIALTITALYSGGLDIVLAILLLTITTGIATTTLPATLANRLILISGILASGFFVIGLIDPFERVYYSFSQEIPIFTAVILVAFGWLIIRQFRTFALRAKMIITFIIIATLSVAAALIYSSNNTRRALQQNAQQNISSGAIITATGVNDFIAYNINTVNTTSTYLDLHSYLTLPKERRAGSQAEAQTRSLLKSLSDNNPYIISYGLLDTQGINVMDSRPENIGHSEAEYEYFQQPTKTGQEYVSSTLYLPNEQEASIFFSVPVYNDVGNLLGVLRSQVRASALQSLILELGRLAGQQSFSVLISENQIFLAHGKDPEVIGKMPTQPDTGRIEELKNSLYLPPSAAVGQISLNLPDLAEALSQVETTPFFTVQDPQSDLSLNGVVYRVKSVPWLVVTLQPQAITLAPIQRQEQIALVAALAIIGVAALAGFFLANTLAAPILRLRATAEEFTAGNLDAAAVVETNDEVGALSATFNQMAFQIKETLGALEQRVEERTRDLEQRSAYLENSAEISRSVVSITDPEKLIQQVVELIKNRFNLYYVGLFLADKRKEWAVLKAATGEAGQKMLEAQHRLKIGEGIIGWSIANAQPRIALDVGEGATRFDNPLLPETHSEGALPLRSRGRVLGALTVQSEQPAAFDQDILNTLQTMADQIAVALDNAELFSRSEAALEAERKAYGELGREAWLAFLSQQTIPGYVVSPTGDIHVASEESPSDVTQAIQIGQIIQKDDGTIFIPIKARDQVLGTVKVSRPNETREWSKEQVTLAEAISEQLSLTLENVRLFEEAQKRAARERVISEASTRMRESMNVESVLRSAAQELHKAFGNVETEVWVGTDETTKH